MNSRIARILPFFGLTLMLLGVRADAPFPVAWQQTFGGTNTDTFASLQRTSDGGFILGGSSYSGATGNKTSTNYGDYDYWVIRLDTSGAKMWEVDLGGTNTENLNFVQQVGDGGYIVNGQSFSGISGTKTSTLYGSSDGWVLKLDSNGGKVWERSFGGASIDGVNAVHTSVDGGYILAASSFSGVSGNKTSPFYGLIDAWILKLDANGDKLWDYSFGGTSSDGAVCLDDTHDGGYIFGGASSSGITGNKTSPNYGGSDYWVVKLDASGNKVWESTYGGSGGDTMTKLLRTPDNGFILGGHSASGITGTKTSPNHGGTDFWVIKTDASGNKVWENSFGGSGSDEMRALTLSSDGGYFLGGYSTSPVSGNKTSPNHGVGDYWLIKLDPNGNKVWEHSFGGTAEDQLYGIQETQDAGILLGGYSSSPISGNKTSAHYGTSSDIWVIKLARPELTIARSGQQVVLSWPSPSTGFRAEQNSILSSTGWTEVLGTPNDNGTTKRLILDIGEEPVFYRLVSP